MREKQQMQNNSLEPQSAVAVWPFLSGYMRETLLLCQKLWGWNCVSGGWQGSTQIVSLQIHHVRRSRREDLALDFHLSSSSQYVDRESRQRHYQYHQRFDLHQRDL